MGSKPDHRSVRGRLAVVALAGGLTLAGAAPALAGAAAAAPASARPDAVAQGDTITVIGRFDKTITSSRFKMTETSSGKTFVVKVSGSTKITLNGTSSSLSAIKAGYTVTVRGAERLRILNATSVVATSGKSGSTTTS